MAKNALTLPQDGRYLEFVRRYAFDLTRFSIEVCGTVPTYQQVELFDSVAPAGSRTSVSSGHGTGKTAGFAIIAFWHLTCYANSNTILSAPKLSTIHDGVWKEFADLKIKIQAGAQAWIADYFEIETQRVYIKGFKLSWWVVAKTAPRGSPENLAGAHRDWLLWLVDEASGVPDANFGVITGSLTDERNRMCIASQPTRASGFFADTHDTLAIENGGTWNALTFSSEDSPIVSEAFIEEKKLQYTREEYDIKVLGKFSAFSSKYLIGPRAIEDCYGRHVIEPHEDWGWMLSSDVGGGGYRDTSTIFIFKVIGEGEFGPTARRVQLHRIALCSNEKDPTQLPGDVIFEASRLANSNTMIDAGGMGLIVCKYLERDDFHAFTKVNWGVPNFKAEYKTRYSNMRAQSICGLSRAVEEGRFGIDPGIDKAHLKRIVREGSRIPYHWDDKGRRYIAKKEDMKGDGLPSPDVWDTCAFPFLESAHYTPSGMNVVIQGGEKDAARAKLLASMGIDDSDQDA